MSTLIEVLESKDVVWTRDKYNMRVRKWIVDSDGTVHEVRITGDESPR